MNSEGSIQRLPGLARDAQRRRAPRELVSAGQDGPEPVTEQSNGSIATAPKIPKRGRINTFCTLEDVDDKLINDRELCSYYLGSTSRIFVVTFLCAIAATSVLERMPGE